MLVLSRKEGESITFPELGVEVRVVGLRKSKVQLGIEAPKEITVSRGEQVDRVPRNGRGISETEQTAAEFVRLETAVIALAEMAGRGNCDEASRIAGEAIERIAAIKRSMRITSGKDSEPKAISELVTVRNDVIDRLRIGQPEETQPANCVRQAAVGYSVLSPSRSVA